MRFFYIMITALIFNGSLTFAGIAESDAISGVIVKINPTTVVISQKKGHHVIVNRQFIPKNIRLRVGRRVSLEGYPDRSLASTNKRKAQNIDQKSSKKDSSMK